MSAVVPGLDVSVERGIAIIRVRGADADARRIGEQAMAQLRAFGTKGLRGVLVDLASSGASGGPALAALADAFAPILAGWEARGLPSAVVSATGRAQLEAARVVAQSAPRWGRAVGSQADGERWLGVA